MKHYRLPVIFALLVLACVLELVERSSIKPRIVQPFEFEELTVSSFDEVPDIDSLFEQKISMGGQDGYEFLRLDPEDNKANKSVFNYVSVCFKFLTFSILRIRS